MCCIETGIVLRLFLQFTLKLFLGSTWIRELNSALQQELMSMYPTKLVGVILLRTHERGLNIDMHPRLAFGAFVNKKFSNQAIQK